MENRKIDTTIVVVGVTEGEGIILLAKQEATPESQCVTFVRDGGFVSPLKSVAQATSFNAFNEVSQESSSNIIDLLNQQLSQDEIDVINNHLTNESDKE